MTSYIGSCCTLYIEDVLGIKIIKADHGRKWLMLFRVVLDFVNEDVAAF